MNKHAKHERELASLVAQETLEDLYGGQVRTFNGPAFLVGVCFILALLALFAFLVLSLMPDTASAAAPTNLFLPVVTGAGRQFVLDCMNGAGQLIPCPTVVP